MKAGLTAALLLIATSSADPACPDACVGTWTPPTTNADGTPLTNLAGFRIYTDGVQVADVPQPPEVIPPITGEGTHVVVVTAYNTVGAESVPSEPSYVMVAALPPPPSDTAPPTITAVVTAPRQVTVSAADDVALARIVVTIQGKVTTYLTNAAAWSQQVQLSNAKTVKITATATDAAGKSTTATLTVTR